MNNLETEITKNVYSVTTTLSVMMVIIYLLFYFNILANIPCNKSIKDVFYGQFVHIDIYHLFFNIYTLYSLSRIEREMGYKSFIYLLIFLLIFNTIVEYFLRYIFTNLKCSIGFSGILFGFITWDMVSKKQLDKELIISIILLIFLPSTNSQKVSFVGHTIGAISGITAAILWKKIS